MKRVNPLRAAMAIAVVALLSLGSARAAQAWTEHQALDSSQAARASVDAALAHARQIGVSTARLAPALQQESWIARAAAPGSSILWGSKASFYDHQTSRYRRLLPAIAADVRAATDFARSQARASIARYRGAIDRARSYDVDTTAEASDAAAMGAELATDTTPVTLRALASRVDADRNQLLERIQPRADYVTRLMASNGSRDAIVQQATQEQSDAQGQLALLSSFSKHSDQLASSLSRAGDAVAAQTTVFGAAVKEADIHDVIQQIAAEYRRVLPAKVILVSTEDQWAHMYENGAEVYNTPVTTGGPDLPTDHGVFHIYAKFFDFTFHSPWPPGSPYYYPPTPVSFWMPFDGGEGLHDASWRSNFGPGSNLAPTNLGDGNVILGTHGCVNLPYDAAQFVWDWAPVGTTVVVV